MAARYILLVIIVLSITGCSFYSGARQAAPGAVQGVLDLTSYDLNKSGMVPLDGQWEFYWRQLLGPQDFRGQRKPAMSGYIKVPSIWNGTMINGEKLGGEGFGTYRLLVKMRPVNGRLGVKMMTFSSAYCLYVNGEYEGGAGRVGIDRGSTVGQHLPAVVFFRNSSPADENGITTVELIYQVANFDHFKGGFWYSAWFGKAEFVQKGRDGRVAVEMFIVGILLVMGLYHFVLFALRPQNSYTFFFGVFCTVIALRAGLMGENLLVALFPGMPWGLKVKMEMLTFFISPPLFSTYISRFYREFFIEKINRGFLISVVPFVLIEIFLPFKTSYPFFNLYVIIVVLIALYVLYVAMRAYSTRKRETIAFIAGFTVLLFTMGYDILSVNQVIYAYPIFPFGLCIFIISQSIMMSIQSAGAFHTAELLTVELENKVIERTNELQNERNALKGRNDIIEKDLEVARAIQLKLIPANSPYPGVAFYYRPMDKLGGDFFDFIQFRDADSIGFFISDVSGHGVPAAFITSMIKTLMLQAGPLREDPAALLTHLDAILTATVGEHFVTAFYGILNRNTGMLTFSNAGHYPPYLISENEINILKHPRKSLPLALMTLSNSIELKRAYSNATVNLAGYSKLFMFTDGMIEARNVNEYRESMRNAELPRKPGYRIPDFEMMRLADVIRVSRNLTAAEFIDAVVASLIEFRGSELFDDDICMVCVDI